MHGKRTRYCMLLLLAVHTGQLAAAAGPCGKGCLVNALIGPCDLGKPCSASTCQEQICALSIVISCMLAASTHMCAHHHYLFEMLFTTSHVRYCSWCFAGGSEMASGNKCSPITFYVHANRLGCWLGCAVLCCVCWCAACVQTDDWATPCEVCGRTYAHTHVRALYSTQQQDGSEEEED